MIASFTELDDRVFYAGAAAVATLVLRPVVGHCIPFSSRRLEPLTADPTPRIWQKSPPHWMVPGTTFVCGVVEQSSQFLTGSPAKDPVHLRMVRCGPVLWIRDRLRSNRTRPVIPVRESVPGSVVAALGELSIESPSDRYAEAAVKIYVRRVLRIAIHPESDAFGEPVVPEDLEHTYDPSTIAVATMFAEFDVEGT